MHSHRQIDGQTDDRMMPIADHAVQQYDRLKIAVNAQVSNQKNKIRY